MSQSKEPPPPPSQQVPVEEPPPFQPDADLITYLERGDGDGRPVPIDRRPHASSR
jgi:hypothetical protein